MQLGKASAFTETQILVQSPDNLMVAEGVAVKNQSGVLGERLHDSVKLMRVLGAQVFFQ
jgi:hypothetical protein